MRQIIALFAITIILTACSKEKIQRYDWQLVDNLGNYLPIVYDKTEDELIACLNNGSCGTWFVGNLRSCNYFNIDEPRYCWNINGNIIGPWPQKMANCFSQPWPDSSRLPGVCSSNPCERWYTRYKRTYKPTGNFAYSYIISKNYCTSDTITLFNGPSTIVVKDDIDSLVILQRTKTGYNFY